MAIVHHGGQRKLWDCKDTRPRRKFVWFLRDGDKSLSFRRELGRGNVAGEQRPTPAPPCPACWRWRGPSCLTTLAGWLDMLAKHDFKESYVSKLREITLEVITIPSELPGWRRNITIIIWPQEQKQIGCGASFPVLPTLPYSTGGRTAAGRVASSPTCMHQLCNRLVAQPCLSVVIIAFIKRDHKCYQGTNIYITNTEQPQRQQHKD